MFNGNSESMENEVSAVLLPECAEGSTLDAASLLCRPCALCGPHRHAKRRCDATRDTECECDRDFYYEDGEVGREGCRACDLCPHGWGAHSPCTQHRNSVCRKCRPGTYSSLLSAQLECFPCSVCRKQQIMLHNCTQIQDTVCVEASREKGSKVSGWSSSTPNSAHLNFLQQSEQASVWPIYSALLLTLLAAILAYFLLKRRHKPRPALRHAPPTHISVLSREELFRDVCRSKRRTLENMLDDERSRNWRHLALALGYAEEKIKELESRPKAVSCSRRLLNEWAASRPLASTLRTLKTALCSIGRKDVVDLLWSAQALTCLCAERALCNCFLNKFDKHLLLAPGNQIVTVDIL